MNYLPEVSGRRAMRVSFPWCELPVLSDRSNYETVQATLAPVVEVAEVAAEEELQVGMELQVNIDAGARRERCLIVRVNGRRRRGE